MMEIRCEVQTRDILGECPVWNPADSSLYWVDIERKLLQRFHRASGESRCHTFPERIGAFAFHRPDTIVAALESGIYAYNTGNASLSVLAAPECGAGTRFNDGKCDRGGRFWAGTMDLNARERLGSLYCLDASLECRRVVRGIGIPNGLAWSPDGATFYYADSLERTIYACDFDSGAGSISNRRVFANTRDMPGLPDGSTVDEEGYLWNAQCGGWQLVRYAPDGSIDRTVPLPVQYPTSCTFGGWNGATLYVTTAVWDLDEVQLAAQPFAGGVLALEPGVRGGAERWFSHSGLHGGGDHP